VQTTSELQLQLEDARNQNPKVMPDQWREVQVIPCDHKEKIQEQQQEINNLKSILTKEQGSPRKSAPSKACNDKRELLEKAGSVCFR
jgi:hypothetical protein